MLIICITISQNLSIYIEPCLFYSTVFLSLFYRYFQLQILSHTFTFSIYVTYFNCTCDTRKNQATNRKTNTVKTQFSFVKQTLRQDVYMTILEAANGSCSTEIGVRQNSFSLFSANWLFDQMFQRNRFQEVHFSQS